MKVVKNTATLRKVLVEGQRDFALVLQFGLISRKTIKALKGGRFRVRNHIDDTVQVLTGRELYSQSNIGRGMKGGAFTAINKE